MSERWADRWPFEWQIGWRYLRAGASGRRTGFVSFISAVSVAGIALGVAALIVVLSVVNGFQSTVRARMLDVIAHVEVFSPAAAGAGWQALADAATALGAGAEAVGDPAGPSGPSGPSEASAPSAPTRAPKALGADGRADAAQGRSLVAVAAPLDTAQLLLGRGEVMRGVLLRGVLPALEQRVSPVAGQHPVLAGLPSGRDAVVLGAELARQLRAGPGDVVTLVLPAAPAAAAGPQPAPRLRPLTVAGVVDTGHFSYDSAVAWVHRDDLNAWLAASPGQGAGPALQGADPAPPGGVQALPRRAAPGVQHGVQLRLHDADAAPAFAALLRERLPGLAAAGGLTPQVSDWTRVNQVWFESVRLQKRMLAVILVLIVAVAAFNLVATLVMAVTDKRGDIAILRTLGASPRSVMAIFMVQGALSGVVGTAAGVVLGLAVALNIDVLVPALERLLGTHFLSPDVYLLSRMPSEPHLADVLPIAGTALALSLAATLYPSWRASRQRPAEALRGE